MPKHNGANSKKGKGPAKGPATKKKKVLKQRKRTKFTIEQRVFACELKKSGKKGERNIKIIPEKIWRCTNINISNILQH